jgi:iron complex transport system ATP-binding protein
MSAALQTRALRLKLGGREVLHGLDLAVAAGRWSCIVGPNGAGKSSLLQALAGLLPYTGEVLLQGRPLAHWGRSERARQVAWLGQSQEAAEDLLARDLVMLGRLPHQDWQARATAQDEAAVQEALQATDTLACQDRAVGTLSGGERQRVLLARALSVQAPVLLMDEPLAHLDAPHQARWWRTVRALVDQGRTVVSVLHDMSLALQADELLVLRSGRLVHQGPPSDAATREAVHAVFEQSLAIHALQGQWVAVPRLGTDAEPRAAAS